MERESFQIGHTTLSVAKTGEGIPFVFQHGLCGSAHQTAAAFPLSTNWQLLTMECRGHGDSQFGEIELLSIAQFTQDLARFIKSLGIGPVAVGGISMGAAIALRLAVKHPYWVKGLVLARPAWIDQAAPKNLAPNRDVARLLAAHDPARAKSLFEESETAALLRTQAPDNLSSLLSFFERTPYNETQALLEAISSDGPDVTIEEIANLNLPTLVIGTAQDVIHPLAMAHELAALISNARFVEITAKSSNPVQYQAEFQAALRRFLQEIE